MSEILHDPVKLGLILSSIVLVFFVLRDPRPRRLLLCALAAMGGWWVTGLLKITWMVDSWEMAQTVGAGIGLLIALALMALLDF